MAMRGPPNYDLTWPKLVHPVMWVNGPLIRLTCAAINALQDMGMSKNATAPLPCHEVLGQMPHQVMDRWHRQQVCMPLSLPHTSPCHLPWRGPWLTLHEEIREDRSTIVPHPVRSPQRPVFNTLTLERHPSP